MPEPSTSSRGSLAVVGIGPSGVTDMTHRAHQTILDSDVVIGYQVYLDQVAPLLSGKEVLASRMGKERERAMIAFDRAAAGARVALLSGGDAGIYGMASPIVEELIAAGELDHAFDVVIVPGLTASVASASLVGAPLAQDHAVISLSDRFVPWSVIEERLRAVMLADLVLVIYEPSSKHRPLNMSKATDVIREFRGSDTPVAVVTDAYREGQGVELTSLEHLLDYEFDMRTTVIIGNSQSVMNGRWMATPRFHTGVNED